MRAFAQNRLRQVGLGRGFWTSLLFFGYLVWGQPLVLQRLAGVVERDWTDPVLGGLLLAAPFLELVGLWLKRGAFFARLQTARPDTTWLWAAWIAHTAVAVTLVMSGLKAVGIPVEALEAEPAGVGQGWAMAAFGAVVVKELALLLAVWLRDPNRGEVQLPAPGPARVGELLVLPFSLLGFTVLWDYAAVRAGFSLANPLLALLDLAGWSLLFGFAYFGARAAALVETGLELDSPLSRWVWLGMIGLNWIAALMGLQ